MSSNLKLFKCPNYQPVFFFSFDSEGEKKEENDINQSNVDAINMCECCIQVPSDLTYITH